MITFMTLAVKELERCGCILDILKHIPQSTFYETAEEEKRDNIEHPKVLN